MIVYHLSIIATPKYILREMRNIERDSLWGSSKKKNKWALLAWETVCLPKLKGDLGLRDPKTLIQTLGAKIWWNWMNNPHSQWANLWKIKYAQNQQTNQIIRMNNAPPLPLGIMPLEPSLEKLTRNSREFLLGNQQ